MIYKPKYCCNCGEKIERPKDTFLSSSRFCPLCATDFVAQEWAPRIAFIVLSVFGIVGITSYFQTAEKPLKIASVRPSEPSGETKKTAAEQPSVNEKSATNSVAKAPLQNAANIEVAAQHQNTTATAERETVLKAAEKQSSDNVPTYFCGAATKKGTPCSRRVKGGGRCWQHVGQPAVLPPEKLIASR